MIGLLNGRVAFYDDPYLVLDVNGVGYKVLVTKEVLSKSRKEKNLLLLFIHTHVKDDAIDLYGFSAIEDLRLFENLISVSGVGPKTAMNIFNTGTRAQISQAIISADTSFFKSVPRLGQKNAQKIIIELKNKFGGIKDLDLSDGEREGNEEVVGALKGFGFTAPEIYKAIKNVKKQGQKVGETIKLALKYLGR